MSRTALLVACTVSLIVAMFIVGVVLKYLVANFGVWIVVPWLALMFFIGYLIDRHEKRKGSDLHTQDGPRLPRELP
jgi:hypothetical protein